MIENLVYGNGQGFGTDLIFFRELGDAAPIVSVQHPFILDCVDCCA